MMRNLLFPVLILGAGCEEEETEEVEFIHSCSENWDDEIVNYRGYNSAEIQSGFMFLGDDRKAMAFTVRVNKEEDMRMGLWMQLAITNMSLSEDCPVAVYSSESPPQLDGIDPLGAETDILHSHDDLGTLEFSTKLAHARSISGELVTRTESPFRTLSQDMGNTLHVTMLTCGDAEIDVEYVFKYYECGPNDKDSHALQSDATLRVETVRTNGARVENFREEED